MNAKKISSDKNIIIVDKILKSKDVKYELYNIIYSRNYTTYQLKIYSINDIKKALNIENDIVMCKQSEKGVFVFQDMFDEHNINIQIPNKKIYSPLLVDYLNKLDDFVYSDIHDKSIYYILGEDYKKNCIVSNISNMLVGGDINSGVNNFIKAMITSLVYKYSQNKLNLVLIDPKNTQLKCFEKLPHVLYNKVFNKNKDVIDILDEIILKVKERIKNKAEICESPKIIIFFDEYIDYMYEDTKQIFQEKICYIAKNSTKSGIYLVMVTQKVFKGTIAKRLKNAFSFKISFNLSSREDSRLFINYDGAIHLLGFGDMLTKKEDGSVSGLKRCQAYSISDNEIKKIVDDLIVKRKTNEKV